MTINIIISWWIVILLHDLLIVHVLMSWRNRPFEDLPPKFEFTYRAIEQGLHVDEVARKMVGYTKQQVRYALWHCCTQSYIQNLVDEFEESFTFLHCISKHFIVRTNLGTITANLLYGICFWYFGLLCSLCYCLVVCREAIEFLVNEGFIYSTIDDDHYKSTTA